MVPRFTLAAQLVAVSLVLGCGGESLKTAAQLVLTPDPSISSTEQLLSQVHRIELIVDCPGGLSGISAPGAREDGSEAIDWDQDGELEVRFSGPPITGDELPVLEVGLAGNADRELSFRLLGFAAAGPPHDGRLVAEGGASARVPAGQVRRVGAPFNLTPAAQPPHVLLFLPPAGTLLTVPLAAVTVLLSTTIEEGSLAGNLLLETPSGETVPLSASVETVLASTGPFSQQSRSLLTIPLPDISDDGTYKVQIGPGLMSSAGQRFDQDSATSTEDAFISHFLHELSVGGGHPCDLCSAGYECTEDETGCVPMLDCLWGCGTGMVCAPEQQQCVEDCRTLELCFDAAKRCDEDTGLCR